MPTATAFRSGNSLAVRFPKSAGIKEGMRYSYVTRGDAIVLTPEESETVLDEAFWDKMAAPVADGFAFKRPPQRKSARTGLAR